jgi:hypothetical protein
VLPNGGGLQIAVDGEVSAAAYQSSCLQARDIEHARGRFRLASTVDNPNDLAEQHAHARQK